MQPRLRFKGFNGDWRQERLSQITKVTMGQSPLSKNYTYNSSDNLLIQGNADLANGKIAPRFYTKQVTKLSYQGDTILTVRAPVGVVAVNNYGKAVIGRGVANISKNTFIRFWLEYFQNSKGWLRYSTGSTFNSVNSKIIKNLSLFCPNLSEQHSIGRFFAKLDKLISLQRKKCTLLRRQRAGYSQKFFRNTQYSDYANLSSLCEIKTGNKNAQDNKPNGKYPFFDRSTKVKHLDTYDYDEETIIYPGEGEKFLPRYFNGKYSLHQRAYSLYKFKHNLINVRYLYEFLLTQSNRFIRYAVGTTVKSLRMDCFKHIKIPIMPLSKQKELGNFLTLLDNLINLQDKKLASLKKLKKAYLQKMFC